MRKWLRQSSLNVVSDSSSPHGFPASAKIRKYHYDKVSDKPDVIGTHILINVDQYQNAWQKNAEQDVGDLRDGVGRIKIWEQEKINEQNDPRKKQRKDQKVKIHTNLAPPVRKPSGANTRRFS